MTTVPTKQILTSGYQSSIYAGSYEEFGKPLRLKRSGAWILVREIPEHKGLRDAMSIYPFLCCDSWVDLEKDLAEITDLVCLTAVPDPYGDYKIDNLKHDFPDLFRENYKLAGIADMKKDYREFVSKKRQKAAVKALTKLEVEVVTRPKDCQIEFTALYDQLIERHNIQGMRRFSHSALKSLLKTPGLVYVRAKFEDKTIGAHTWVIQKNKAYAHLAAYDCEIGYKMAAPSALYWTALKYFSSMNITSIFYGGFAAGASTSAQNNLLNFKKGWESDVKKVHLCGRVFQHDVYKELSKSTEQTSSSYFPAYRSGEFF